VKVEPDRWYYWCDKLGLLVWQDMPSGGPGPGAVGQGAGRNKQTGKLKDGTAVSPEAGAQFEAELKAMVEGRWNHPSIIMWVVFNEGWGQHDTPRLTKWVKGLDPSRLVNNASGGHDIPAGDVMDAHRYPGPGAPNPSDGRAGVLGEFGGLGLPMTGHTWVQKTWGYRGMADQAELTSRYAALLQSAYQLKDTAGLNAVIYTQTTDVETECNGLLTYDREIVKPDLQKTADANRGKFPPAK
jgi:beta-galactosidase/beta-glucuronidase